MYREKSGISMKSVSSGMAPASSHINNMRAA